MRRRPAALFAVLLVTAACSRNEERTVSLVIEVTEPSPGRVVLEAPAQTPAGVVAVTLRNSASASHDVQLVRVEGERSVEEVVDLVSSDGAPIPPWFHPEGGVTSVPPGASHSATRRLLPGSYYIVDTGTDAAGIPFAQVGGVRPLTVEDEDTGASPALPEADVTVSATEHSFGLPPELDAGSPLVRFDNRGIEPHMVVAAPLLPGRTLDDVRRSLASVGDPPPALDVTRATGTQIVDGGTSILTKMTFSAGVYVFVCFVNDRAGGPPHHAVGMLQELRVR
ncbi:MAG TPA: hypothetical protein VF045_02325 [Acidimicrobiales bacterium]